MGEERTPPAISVIICTRDRAESLRQTLASLAHVRVPHGCGAELLVLDNGSRDHTRDVVAAARVPAFDVRYVCEPSPGQSRARNTGVRASRGRVVLFTDDDVRPPSDWVERVCGPILRGEADVVAGGVRIAPHLERPGLRGLIRTWYAATDHLTPDTPGLVGVGANMAFCRRVWDSIGGFDERLGPGALGGADDTLCFEQARAAGFRIRPVLDCEVEHHFDPARLSRASILRCAAAYGRSAGYLQYHWRGVRDGVPPLLPCWKRMVLLAKRLVRRPWQRAELCDEWEAVAMLVIHMLDQMRREAVAVPRAGHGRAGFRSPPPLIGVGSGAGPGRT